MTWPRGMLAAVFLAGFGAPAAGQAVAPPNRTYDAVVEGMSCRQQGNGRLDCVYTVGEAVRFTIAGVGEEDAVVHFAKVDSTAGYMAAFAPLHGCVVVKPTRADSATALAFVSPRDGRVYRAWQLCRQPPRR